ncbi:MAG: UTP--glucose-1-phosphate uridylyltransferase, partial [Marmoricola sp.]|nr:UTP--glucose-1-phosphate uridylyltransferase [Marmoricola sp.]
AQSGAPFAIEAVRRTPSDRKGGHFAKRKADGRIILRETAQTSKQDQDALQDLDRHKFCSTNNLWFDLQRMRDEIVRRDGVLGLPMIRNEKNVDPGDPATPKVIQIETAMGAAIEVFPDSRTIEVSRSRFVPVKTTNDLLVLRSDAYDLGQDFVLDQVASHLPYVDLDADHYKVVEEFDKRFPAGVPSLKEAESLTVKGDWTFGGRVQVKGTAKLDGDRGRVEEGAVIGEGSGSR